MSLFIASKLCVSFTFHNSNKPYGLDGPRIESQWGEVFRPSRPALEPIQPSVQWVLGLSRRKVRPGRAADP